MDETASIAYRKGSRLAEQVMAVRTDWNREACVTAGYVTGYTARHDTGYKRMRVKNAMRRHAETLGRGGDLTDEDWRVLTAVALDTLARAAGEPMPVVEV